LFWLEPAVWDQKQRDGKTHAMCDVQDLKKMFDRVQKEEWQCVYVIDAEGEFDEDQPE
jgi:hypothetical protein